MTDKATVMDKQQCPFCRKKTLTLTEAERDVPYFGKVFLFSMTCSSCKYHKADVESAEQKTPTKFSLEVSKEDDMKIRIVRSSEATIKIPHITTITPGPASNGYITNVEGILRRVKHQIEVARDNEEDEAMKKKAKNLLKKLNKVMWGQDRLKMTIEDPTGNSAIISEKAVKSKL
ncbi:MAG: ZPR1 zinc finger domain-containing protein [Nanoarchaeota archaeon]|nr:ZPR1 zinc finger domain-containing protein [Nanoarchaeota archaeon]